MLKTLSTTFASLMLACVSSAALAAATIGETAPDFSTSDIEGHAVSLSQYRGKPVVLEWNNPECPFVKKFYGSGNMQKFQQTHTADGVVWLTINSSAPGKQGHLTAAEAAEMLAGANAKPTAYITDESGEIGKSYDAKTTPHMYVIDKSGTLVYRGAIDSNSSADPDDIAGAENYVELALAELADGKPVSTPVTNAYGCSVKY